MTKEEILVRALYETAEKLCKKHRNNCAECTCGCESGGYSMCAIEQARLAIEEEMKNET